MDDSDGDGAAGRSGAEGGTPNTPGGEGGDAGAATQDPDPSAGAGGTGNPDGVGGEGGGEAPVDPDPIGGEEPSENPSSKAPRFFLPMPEPTNTTAPAIEVDAKGGIHAVYPRYAGGNAFYSYCAAGCSSSDDMSVVEFETQGTVHNAMLALGKDGRPRVLLSTMSKVYFASCDENCGEPSGWEQTEILDHAGDREVTGEAFALDPQGRPRFLMHTYRAFLGIGQKPRMTHFVACDADCHDPASWEEVQIANQTWEGTHLRYDAAGRAHVATVANVEENGAVTRKLGAYVSCESDCSEDANWVGTGLYEAYENSTAAVTMHPTVALALTKAGKPRVAVLGKNEGNRNIVYFECDANCTSDMTWTGSIISDHQSIDAGLDLALDSADRPRLAYTLGFNIGLAYCDSTTDCVSETATWDLTKVEFGSDMPKDEIFLWDNCTIAAWFLHSPSLAIDANGAPRVGYQARDISGGVSQPDPTKPRCVAGTDMTWSRLAIMSSHKE